MKADTSKMFLLPLKNLNPEDGAPFPVYLFLKRNDRLIPFRNPGDPLGIKKYELIMQREHLELWVPNSFQEIYLEYLGRMGHPVPELKDVIAEIAAETTDPASAELERQLETKSEEAMLVRDVIEDEELTSEEKARILSSVSNDLLRAINQITTRGEEAREEGLKRCKEIADEILNIAAQNSNIYDEIISLRNSQEAIEHSVMVGTIASMFALALGFSDSQLISDLTVASIFHDIGLVRVKPEVIEKKESDWNLQERKEYESHVLASVAIVKESGSNFHPRVLRLIEEHHENYDGSGFPNGLKGQQIDDMSQLLHLSNLFDRLCTGKQTGTELAPAEAFDYMYELSKTPRTVQEVQPELVQRVFQFMLTEKESAAKMQKSLESQVKETVKSTLGQ